MGELAFAVLRRQLGVVRAKEPGTRLGEDPEELHDMRVATRRLRAALSLFAGVLPVRAQVFRAGARLVGTPARRGARPRRAAAGFGRHGRHGQSTGASVVRRRRSRPARRAGGAARTRAGRRPHRHVERSRLRALGPPGQGIDRHGTAGTGPPLAGHQGPGRDRPARTGVGASRQGRQGGQAGQAVRRRLRFPRTAHPVQAAALRPRVQRRRVRGPRHPLRARAHRPAGRARRDAGRRGGVAPTGGLGHGRGPSACRHHLRHGRRRRTAPARRAPAPEAPARRSCPAPGGGRGGSSAI